MERNWKLGDDLITKDSVLDGFTFDDLILAVHQSRVINENAVFTALNEILHQRIQDMNYLVSHNIQEILAAAKEGREE